MLLVAELDKKLTKAINIHYDIMSFGLLQNGPLNSSSAERSSSFVKHALRTCFVTVVVVADLSLNTIQFINDPRGIE
jgi:hypothetical protein